MPVALTKPRPVITADPKPTSIGLSVYTKIGVIIAKFLANINDFRIDDAIESYAVLKPEKSSIDKLYNTCIKRFKETGLAVIVGKNWTIEKIVSERQVFDKDRFIAENGQEVYDKYCRKSEVQEFHVKPTPKGRKR